MVERSSAGLIIRRAKLEDYPALCELNAEVDRLHACELPHLFHPTHSPSRDLDNFAALLENPEVAYWVAEQDGDLWGFLLSYLRQTPPIPVMVPRRYLVVDTLGVSPDWQRLGIGRMLVEEAERWAVENGADSVELNVYAFNQGAIAFYRALGYETLSHKMSKSLRSS